MNVREKCNCDNKALSVFVSGKKLQELQFERQNFTRMAWIVWWSTCRSRFFFYLLISLYLFAIIMQGMHKQLKC